MPGFASDIYGFANDSLETFVKIAELLDYGTIQLTVKNMSSDTTIMINLLSNKKVIEQYILDRDSVITIPQLIPGEYMLDIIEDLNVNKQWDAGNYLEKRQSERIYKRIMLEKLRENWILEHEVDLLLLKNQSI